MKLDEIAKPQQAYAQRGETSHRRGKFITVGWVFKNEYSADLLTQSGDLLLSNLGLQSLEGCPETIRGTLDISHNKLMSLKGAPSRVGGHLFMHANPITSLQDIHKIIKLNGTVKLDGSCIKSHVLGLFLCGATLVLPHFLISTWMDIVNDHLRPARTPEQRKQAMYACQSELLEKGFDEYAQL